MKTTKVNTGKKIGIWMDHKMAHLMEFSPDEMKTTHIESEFTHHDKVASLSKSESLMNHKEQQLQTLFYNQIGDVIKNYTDVLLFGPTDAKAELLNVLRLNYDFDKIKIDLKTSDKMTEKEQFAFVRAFFTHSHA